MTRHTAATFAFMVGLWLGALCGFAAGVAPKVRRLLRVAVCAVP